MSEQWLSIVEYARKYNISDMTVRRRIKTGKLHAVLREGKYYIPMSNNEPPMASQPYQSAPKPTVPPLVKPSPNPDPMHFETSSYPGQARQSAAFVPKHISGRVSGSLDNQTTTVDGNTLLAFCEGALKKFTDAEIRLENQYQQKIAQLEAQLETKQSEITQMSQQVEDLQVLVKILERKAGKNT